MNNDEAIASILGKPHLFRKIFARGGANAALLYRCFSRRIRDAVENSDFWSEKMDAIGQAISPNSFPDALEQEDLLRSGRLGTEADATEDLYQIQRKIIDARVVMNCIMCHRVMKDIATCRAFDVYYVFRSLLHVLHGANPSFFTNYDNLDVANLDEIAFYCVKPPAGDIKDAPLSLELVLARPCSDQNCLVMDLEMHADAKSYVASATKNKVLYNPHRKKVVVFDFDPDDEHYREMGYADLFYEHGDKQDFKDSLRYFVEVDAETLDVIKDAEAGEFPYNVLSCSSEVMLPTHSLVPSADTDSSSDDAQSPTRGPCNSRTAPGIHTESAVPMCLLVDTNNASKNLRFWHWHAPPSVNVSGFVAAASDVLRNIVLYDECLADVPKDKVVAYLKSISGFANKPDESVRIRLSDVREEERLKEMQKEFAGLQYHLVMSLQDYLEQLYDEDEKDLKFRLCKNGMFGIPEPLFPRARNECFLIVDGTASSDVRVACAIGLSQMSRRLVSEKNPNWTSTTCVCQGIQINSHDVYKKIAKYEQAETFVSNLRKEWARDLDSIAKFMRIVSGEVALADASASAVVPERVLAHTEVFKTAIDKDLVALGGDLAEYKAVVLQAFLG